MDSATADQERQGKGGCGRIVGGVLLAVILCFVAMVAVLRWLKRPQIVNEVRALSDVRTIISAQTAWQSANGGYYEGELSCLASPARCLPDYPRDGPMFLAAPLASQAPKDGYVRAFVAGSRPKKIDPRVSSRSSVDTWTYTARPVEQGRTGYRSFFADETGVIRATSEDRAANVSDPPIE